MCLNASCHKINTGRLSLCFSPPKNQKGYFLVNIVEELDLHRIWIQTNGKEGNRFIAKGRDFSKFNFSAADLRGADLSGAYLFNADLSETNLRKSILFGAHLDGANLSRANLSGACLGRAELSMANLSDAKLIKADLSEAQLIGANLKGSKLIRANLFGARLIQTDLSDANLNQAYLSTADINQAILVRSKLIRASLFQVNLFGANLSQANLSRASLIGANLNQANLTNVNFIGANLSGIQALKANFASAKLNGSCIENWLINNETVLDGIDCQFIYMRCEQGKYVDRRPSSEDTIFVSGDFAKLVSKAQNTVDLIFRNGIDWQALAISLDKFKVESGSGELSIQAIENKGNGDFVVRVNVPLDSDKAAIETRIKQEYELKVKEIDARNQERLNFKDKEIIIYLEQVSYERQNNIRLAGIIEKMAEQGSSKYDLRGANIGNLADTVRDNAQQQANQYNSEQKQNLAEAAVEIQQILTQLSANHPTTTIAEKSVVATKAVEAIERNPAYKAKLIKVVKIGGIAALKELVEPVMKPITNILFPMLEALSEE